MKKLDVARLASLADEAAQSPRLRMNHNLHQELADPIQRLAIAMEKFLHLPPLPHLATIPHDRLYATAVRQHQLAAAVFPQCAAVEALRKLAQSLA